MWSPEPSGPGQGLPAVSEDIAPARLLPLSTVRKPFPPAPPLYPAGKPFPNHSMASADFGLPLRT